MPSTSETNLVEGSEAFTIWIDADACPKIVKEVVFKISFRLKVPVCLVANSYLSIPLSPIITFIQVDKGLDMADSYIVQHVSPNDIVITADIPLAALVVEKEALALNPRGELYTEDNVSERLSIRDFMQGLRDSGMDTGGPAPYSSKDKASFTNMINKMITQKLKKLE